MKRSPIFETTADAAEFLAQHDRLAHFLTVCQYARFLEFLCEASDGDTALPALLLEFFRGELSRLDNIVNGGQ
jgi:hypothetical protein